MLRKDFLLNILRFVGDIFFVNLSLFLVLFFRFREQLFSSYMVVYSEIAPYLTLFAIIIFYLYNLYSDQLKKETSDIIFSLILACFLLVVFSTFFIYFFQPHNFYGSFSLLIFLIMLSFMILWRYLLILLEKKFTIPPELVIIGRNQEVEKLKKSIKVNTNGGYKIKQVIIIEGDSELNRNKYRTKLAELKPDEIFLTSDLTAKEKKFFLYLALENGWKLSLVPDLYEMMVSGGNLIQIGEMPVFKIKGLLDEEGYYSKRIFEIIFSVMALTVLSPLMLLVAVAIKLDSPGSIFYTQKRVGKEGKIFRVYKFRTMEEDAERDTGPVLASEDDRRLTRLGRFLRRTRIDEFPQLFNVLKGEMSIIGPRPERPYFVEEYEKRIKDYKFRHLNKSGITGLAQINGFYSSDPEDKLKLDLLYNNKKSPLLDIKILLQTIKVMFLGDRTK